MRMKIKMSSLLLIKQMLENVASLMLHNPLTGNTIQPYVKDCSYKMQRIKKWGGGSRLLVGSGNQGNRRRKQLSYTRSVQALSEVSHQN